MDPELLAIVLAGRGAPLDTRVQEAVAQHLGADVGAVRVYTGPEADLLSEQAGRMAFAVGDALIFGQGAYRPETPEGQRLLADGLAAALDHGPGAHGPTPRAASVTDGGGVGGHGEGGGAVRPLAAASLFVGTGAATGAHATTEAQLLPIIYQVYARPARTGSQAGGSFQQVEYDLRHGKFADALTTLDRYWPASVRDMAGPRAHIGGLIVHKFYAALVPLSMYKMLVALAEVGKARLDEVIADGHRLRDLLLASASGLEWDRLAYALTVLDKGLGALNGPQPHYLIGPPITRTQDITYFGDYEDVVAYLTAIYGTQATAEYEIQPLGNAGDLEKDIQIAAVDFQLAAQAGVTKATTDVGKDAISYTAWWGNIVGTLIGPAVCLLPVDGVALPLLTLGLAAAGTGVMAATSVPTDQESFHDVLTDNIGAAGTSDIRTTCGYIQNNTSTTAVNVFHKARDPRNRWSGHHATSEALKILFQPEFVAITKGGLAQIDQDAVTNRVYRDLMLSVVKVAGQVVYEYRATNAIHSYNEDAASFTLNPPDLWTYTPDKTVLRVPSQIVTPLSNVLDHGGVIGADLQIPKAIMVSAPDDVGTTGTLWFFVGDKGEVEASSFPLGVPIFNPLAEHLYRIQGGVWRPD